MDVLVNEKRKKREKKEREKRVRMCLPLWLRFYRFLKALRCESRHGETPLQIATKICCACALWCGARGGAVACASGGGSTPWRGGVQQRGEGERGHLPCLKCGSVDVAQPYISVFRLELKKEKRVSQNHKITSASISI